MDDPHRCLMLKPLALLGSDVTQKPCFIVTMETGVLFIQQRYYARYVGVRPRGGFFLAMLCALVCRSQLPARSEAWVCGRSPAGIVGSNPTGGMDVCLLWVLCIVMYRSLRRADYSSRGVLPTVLRRCVWSRNIVNEEAMAHWGAVAPETNTCVKPGTHYPHVTW